ncbi:GntR family transcriptional regulator [Pleomorphochaeta sp. DL1XJH-081]|jgi:DNA-binding GntR family transcriptional regulator|uniref:GntR family transcriptional regulator n=1 Tax=Pleomorphochaeta sp. DL1XJH-081 TaxID=3409690 RepID=UPI003BB7A48A
MQLKYQSVFMDIQNKILSGYWPENAMIPTELELCKKHDVSRITVRRALDDLVQMGLIRRARGKGSFVCKTKQYAEYRNGLVSQDGVEFDTRIFNRILEDSLYDPNSDLAKNLLPNFKLSPASGDGLVRIRLVRLVDDHPYAVMSIFVPESISKQVDREMLVRRSFLDVYELCTGNKIVTLHRSVSAVIPDDEQCNLLGARSGTAHLWMKNTACLADETPVAMNYALYNGNLFDFAVSIDLNNPPKVTL